jgi:(R,R)-butanediol dehydrogenase/meso-butanediol dehydrogenase/diacetyl reductase
VGAEVGQGVQDVKPGNRVVVKPIPQCKECYWCERGQYSLCHKAFERGFGIGPDNDGAFAEYLRVKYPKEMLFDLPPEVSLEEGALIEPLATSLHAIRMSRFKPGDCTVVLGAGMIGLGVLQFLKLGGAGSIVVLEISPEKSRLAMELGADVVLNPEPGLQGIMEKIMNLTNGVGADIVFECAGVPVSFQTCVNYVKGGGQVIVAGIVDQEVPVQPFFMTLKEAELKFILGYYDEFTYVIEFLRKKKINTKALISDIVPLDDLEEKGFKRLIDSRDPVKILVKP